MATRSVIAGSLLSVAAVSAQAGGSLDFSLADESARLAYDATQANSGLHINASILHDMEDGDMVGLGLHVVDLKNRNKNLYFGVGGKAFLFDTDSDAQGGAVGVGGFFRANVPTHPDFSLAGYAYYAPRVVSFGDAESLLSTDVRAQYAVIPTARVYMGYRYNGVRLEGASNRYELGEGVHFGVQMDF